MADRILLAHGSGGLENQCLIRDIFVAGFENHILSTMDDAAVVNIGTLAVSTDSYTVDPLFFSGGDIGKLAVAGTTNDVSMRGARPLYLTVAFIIEEGFEIDLLKKIVASMASELQTIGVQVITGDTKVVPKGAVDKIIINTTGIGELVCDCAVSHIQTGDQLIVSGPIAEHGACIFAAREEISVHGLRSDCRSLWPGIESLLNKKLHIHAMRDATRGGLSAVLNEWAEQSHHLIHIVENQVPISTPVSGFCEMLGIDPFTLACEGTFVLSVAEQDCQSTLEVLHQAGYPHAALIGTVMEKHAHPHVILQSDYGTERLMEYPSGEILPRIC